MSAENMRVVSRIQDALGMEDVVTALDDETRDRRVREVFAELAEPDFEVTMVGPDYLPRAAEGTGPDGFNAVWADWASAFASFRIEVEDMIDAGDRVVSLVRLVARTRTGDVPIEETGAAVWTMRNGKLARAEFHLDRELALRSAGVDPDAHSSHP
jgi:ketosteroid isomerase-like protein